MEETMKLESVDDGRKMKIEMDNSSEFKDLFIEQAHGRVDSVHFQLDTSSESLEVNGVKLNSRMKAILLEFLSQ